VTSHRSILTASRVRKARRGGWCPLCPRPIVVGQRVGLIPAGWAHLSPCIVDRRQLGALAAAADALAKAAGQSD
jgi:hypothetical protein